MWFQHDLLSLPSFSLVFGRSSTRTVLLLCFTLVCCNCLLVYALKCYMSDNYIFFILNSNIGIHLIFFLLSKNANFMQWYKNTWPMLSVVFYLCRPLSRVYLFDFKYKYKKKSPLFIIYCMCELHFLLYTWLLVFWFFCLFFCLKFQSTFLYETKMGKLHKNTIVTVPVRAVRKVIISHFQSKCCI